MAVAPAYPAGSNTYVPNHEATQSLVVGYSRNPELFALNQYVQIRPVDADQGKYLKITPEEAGRILDSDLSEFVWADGADRPQNNDGTELFAYHDYRTQRVNHAFKLGYKASSQASWSIGHTHRAIKAQQCMTGRTVRVHAVLSAASSWATGHRKDVSAIPGNTGTWQASTAARQDIKRSLNHAAETILKASLGAVRRKDLRLVLNPAAAKRIAESQEIVDLIKGSPAARDQLAGSGQWTEWGLPDALYDFPIAVEDAVKVDSRRGSPLASKQYVMEPSAAYMLARPGKLIAPAGEGPSFSTITLFAFEEMTVEEFRDDQNRRLEGHVVDDNAPVQTASVSGFKFEGVLS